MWTKGAIRQEERCGTDEARVRARTVSPSRSSSSFAWSPVTHEGIEPSPTVAKSQVAHQQGRTMPVWPSSQLLGKRRDHTPAARSVARGTPQRMLSVGHRGDIVVSSVSWGLSIRYAGTLTNMSTSIVCAYCSSKYEDEALSTAHQAPRQYELIRMSNKVCRLECRVVRPHSVQATSAAEPAQRTRIHDGAIQPAASLFPVLIPV